MLDKRKQGRNHWGSAVLIALAITLSATGGIWLWHSSAATDQELAPAVADTPPKSPPSTPTAVAPIPDLAGPVEQGGGGEEKPLPMTPKTWNAGAFAPSLEGTDIDGRLRADAEGNLVLELEVKDFFDYFLSTVGEVSPEKAIDRIQSMATRHLPPEAAQQAVDLLDKYLAFKQRAFELAQQPLASAERQTPEYQLQQLEKAQAALQRLRRETLPPEAVEAFFGLEEAYGDFTLATIRIQQRDDLSAPQKQQMIDYERAQLPPVLQKSYDRVSQSARQAAEVEDVIRSAESPQAAKAKLQGMGLPDAHVQEIVTVLEGQEAFEEQYSEYQQEHEALLQSGLSGADREKAEAALLDRHFKDEQSQTWARLRNLDQAPASVPDES